MKDIPTCSWVHDRPNIQARHGTPHAWAKTIEFISLGSKECGVSIDKGKQDVLGKDEEVFPDLTGVPQNITCGFFVRLSFLSHSLPASTTGQTADEWFVR